MSISGTTVLKNKYTFTKRQLIGANESIIQTVDSLIYNELIICNFCGLNENTWQAIAKKASEEANESNDTADYLELNENYKLGTILSEDDE